MDGGLLGGEMDRAGYGLLLGAQAGGCQRACDASANVCMSQTPDATQEAAGALDAGVGPLQAHVRGRGEHHEQAAGICAVCLDHVLLVAAVVLRLGHLLVAAVFLRPTIPAMLLADYLALVIPLDDHFVQVDSSFSHFFCFWFLVLYI